jgi:hypothetical protein
MKGGMEEEEYYDEEYKNKKNNGWKGVSYRRKYL